jgi:hypothetical protein
MKHLRKLIGSIGFVSAIAFIWFLFELDATASGAADQAKINSQMITQVARLASKVGDQLDLLLKLGAISKETYVELRKLPTTPADSTGEPFDEWYLVGDTVIYLIQTPPDCGATVHQIPIR